MIKDSWNRYVEPNVAWKKSLRAYSAIRGTSYWCIEKTEPRLHSVSRWLFYPPNNATEGDSSALVASQRRLRAAFNMFFFLAIKLFCCWVISGHPLVGLLIDVFVMGTALLLAEAVSSENHTSHAHVLVSHGILNAMALCSALALTERDDGNYLGAMVVLGFAIELLCTVPMNINAIPYPFLRQAMIPLNDTRHRMTLGRSVRCTMLALSAVLGLHHRSWIETVITLLAAQEDLHVIMQLPQTNRRKPGASFSSLLNPTTTRSPVPVLPSSSSSVDTASTKNNNNNNNHNNNNDGNKDSNQINDYDDEEYEEDYEDNVDAKSE